MYFLKSDLFPDDSPKVEVMIVQEQPKAGLPLWAQWLGWGAGIAGLVIAATAKKR